MIISDLEHLETIAEVNEIEGSRAILDLDLDFLALGTLVSVAQIKKKLLATSDKGVSISSGKLKITLAADVELS